MHACTTVPLSVRIPGQEMPRLNLLCPLYGRKRADFTRTAKLAIESTPRKDNAC